MKQMIHSLETYGHVEMANKDMADVYFPRLQTQFPGLARIDAGLHQHFVITTDGGRQLRRLHARLKIDYKFAQSKADGYKQGITNIDNLLKGATDNAHKTD